MKKLSIIVGGVFILFLTSFNVQAQDWEKADPETINVLADTTFLRAYEVTLKPGEKSSMHSHPTYFFYTLSEGKIMVHFKDGKDELSELKVGDSGLLGPELPHITENVGNTTIKYLLVELKERP